MASAGPGLESLVDQIISVITNDGRNIVGTLRGFDQATNIILDESHERVYSTRYVLINCDLLPGLLSNALIGSLVQNSAISNKFLSWCLKVCCQHEGVQQLVLGLYIIRGDNISVVGEVDEELDARLDLSNLRAHPLKPVIH
uniref:U6 snRNA-associated Sm-like protein LSm8 n=1 Tax=Oryza glaberrima TaxID=4538 RepID=I1PYJ8_ORYGL